jgi:hypothetical protein
MKLKGTLPKGEADGLTPLEGRIAKKDSEHVAVMMILDVESTEKLRHTGEIIVKLAIRRAEAILPDDLEAATQLIRRAYESRTGETTLPIELEDDIKAAMAGVSLYEPETERPAAPTAEQLDVDVAPADRPAPPDNEYTSLTIAALLERLQSRGLDFSKGKKPELIWRLIDADDAEAAGTVPSNVTSLFQDGTGYEPAANDEGEGPQTADDYASDVADGKALLGEDGADDDEPGDTVADTVANDEGLAADAGVDPAEWETPWEEHAGAPTDVQDDDGK